ncbi:hypothetical protein GIB67_001070 [Kingdonia uniflora]|uniref:Fatty acid desaturase domain-containing protein n=1 Tax=Kingdonia uniflora TaxID=39325 RepID=A0A7J7MG46_9MAGN|nr:hypothetical protein GIB67_001070 [Kingdonia uniflora]
MEGSKIRGIGGDEKNHNISEIVPVADVVVKQIRRVFPLRNTLDIVHTFIFFSVHSLCLFAPFTFSWGVLRLALVLFVFFGLFGINISYHRNLTHKSFKLPKWLEYTFAYIGLHALQGEPIWWVSAHRYHHKFSDTVKDPHSPIIAGFWYGYTNWVFNTQNIIEKCGNHDNVKDLEMQAYYRFLRLTHFAHLIAFGALMYALGGFPYIIWGVAVRAFLGYHTFFLANAVCHVWGHQAWKTGDSSTNNGYMALISFGEGWHNNHHAFQSSARHGLEWWQIDVTWYVIKLLERIGLATNVKVPSDLQKQKMLLK